jgi:hypothetical protein
MTVAHFQLVDGRKNVGDRFESDEDAFDVKACTDLLRRIAVDNKIPLGRAVLIAFHNRRKVRTYRAT